MSPSVPTWTLTADARQVRGWSLQRLPFGPRGEMLAYRNALRSALRELRVTGSEVLLAEYTIDIRLPDRLGIASVMKPLLDGLISALQTHDGTSREQALKALAPMGDAERLWSQLTDADQAVLGIWRILIPRASGVMWSPGDDRCRGFSINVATGERDRVVAEVRAAKA